MTTRRPGLPRAPVMIAALGAFALSVLLLPNTPGIGDSAEFTLALALAGVPHPTGYPLYVLFGHAFVLAFHALGCSWVSAANLWSAAGAAVAAGAWMRLVQHIDAAGKGVGATASPLQGRSVRTLAVGLPVALLVLHPLWLDSATVAEVYSWNHAWLAVAASFAFGRLRALDAESVPEHGGDGVAAFRWGILCGAGVSHHLLSLLFAVPLSAALLLANLRAGRWRASHLAWGLMGGVLPLAGWAWIAWRAAHPAAAQWPLEPDPASVGRHLLGTAYAGYLGRFAPRGSEWDLIRAALLPWLLPGFAGGACWALRFPRAATRLGLLALWAGAALLIAFIVSYGVPDPAMYFVPALMVALLFAAPATHWVARRLSPLVAVALGAALLIGLASGSVPRALGRRTQLAAVDARIRAAWQAVPFDRGIVLWGDDHLHRLKVFQLLEGSRTELYVESPDALSWPLPRAAFERRFGFDPLAGRVPRTAADIARVPGIIRASAVVPVVEFPALLERVPRAR
ncbi:MAG: DUF2723 domain-containing protein [Candidatus Eisenbacteria bacterium]